MPRSRDEEGLLSASQATGPSASPPSLEDEYRALRENCGVITLERGVLSIEGPEKVAFLHRMLSQDIQSLKEGEGCKAALLDAKGHIQALLRVLVTKQAVLLETNANRVAPVEAILSHYKVGTPVRFHPLTTAVLGLMGPHAEEVLLAVGVDARELKAEGHAEARVGEEGVRVSRATDLPGVGFSVHVRPEAASSVLDALLHAGALPAGRPTVDIRRVEAGRPWFGTDITPDNLLHEAGLVSEYHSATKGCYIGQENVARLEARGGHVNKALLGLRLEAAVPAGTRLDADEQDAGWLTTSVASPKEGAIAMGFVRRPWLEPGTLLSALGCKATVVLLPLESP